MADFRAALENLKSAGCRTVYLDGSFVTIKVIPNDYDACWDEDGVDPVLLDPVLLIFDAGRVAQKAKYMGELFPASVIANVGGLSVPRFLSDGQGDREPQGSRRRRPGRFRMIKNERQYRITKSQADGLSRTLESLSQRARGVHPLIARAQEDALRSQVEELQGELRDYESLLSGGFRTDDLQAIAHLPTMLIKARIAQGLSQKDLAERLGLKEQQIQRYEATEYASASLTRIREVAGALGASER